MDGEKRKIIYIFERRHHYNYDGEMFYINQFERAGYEVEVWSLVNWTFKDVETPLNIDLSGRGIYINNSQEFNNQIERVKKQKCVFVCYPYHAYTSIAAYVRKKIVLSGFQFCNLCESPLFEGEVHFLDENKILLAVLGEIKFIAYYFKEKYRGHIISYREHLYPFKYKSKFNFVCVNDNYRCFPNKLEIFSKRNVVVHSDDYSRINKNVKNDDKKYILFVDQYLTGHSDFKRLGYEFPIDNEKKYFDECNTFFGKIEEKYGCDVIIAAHPKSEYKGNEFGGREILYGKTLQLIKEAEIVLLMTSTIYGMVCYFKKPFIIICSEQMVNGIFWNRLREISKFFGKSILIMNYLEDAQDVSKYVVSANSKYERLVNKIVISKNGIRDRQFHEVMLEKFSYIFSCEG